MLFSIKPLLSRFLLEPIFYKNLSFGARLYNKIMTIFASAFAKEEEYGFSRQFEGRIWSNSSV